MDILSDDGGPANSSNVSYPSLEIEDTFITDDEFTSDPFLIPSLWMLSVFSVIGTFGNFIVLHVFLQRKDKVSSTIFILSLAGIDCMTCLIIIPYTIIMEYIHFNVRYEVLCKAYLFLITFNVPLSSFVMVAIAFDRYFCICHSLKNIMNRRRAKVIIIILVFFAAGLGTITCLTHGVYMLKESNETVPTNLSRPTRVGNDSRLSDLTSRISVDCQADNLTDTMFSASCKEFSEYYNTAVTLKKDGLQDMSDAIQRQRQYDNQILSTDDLQLYMNFSQYVERTVTSYSIEYIGECSPSEVLLSRRFRHIYQKIYAFLFLVDFCLVFVLYVLIYRFLVTRRIKRQRSRSLRSISTAHPASTDNSTLETRFLTEMPCPSPSPVVVAAAAAVAAASSSSGSMRRAAMRHKVPPKERLLMANIRTAAMLFVVTVVFIVVFLPAWLTAMGFLPTNKIVFYSYFLYNVVNPFIYAFMNPMFKKELQKMLSLRKRVIRPRCFWDSDVQASY